MADQQNNERKNTANTDNKDQHLATSADFDQTVREAEAERGELKPGQTQGSNSKQDNNGRGGGK